MYFEGCNGSLGCTILLSGKLELDEEGEYQRQRARWGNANDFSEQMEKSLLREPEIKRVKMALREMMTMARNVILEKAFLFQIYTKIPKRLSAQGELEDDSPFLIKKKVENRRIMVITSVFMKKGVSLLKEAEESKVDVSRQEVKLLASKINDNNLSG